MPAYPGHSCDVAALTARLAANANIHTTLVAEFESQLALAQQFQTYYCQEPCECCTDMTTWRNELAVFAQTRVQEWTALRASAEGAIAAVAHPDPPGCVLRLGYAANAVRAIEDHDAQSRQTWEQVYLPMFRGMTENSPPEGCGGLPPP